MLRIQCKNCERVCYGECQAPPGQVCGQDPCPHDDPDAHFSAMVPECVCCPENHHHGQNAAAMAAAGQGSRGCRPLTLEMLPGSVVLRPVAGG